jgi:hypothetical protein
MKPTQMNWAFGLSILALTACGKNSSTDTTSNVASTTSGLNCLYGYNSSTGQCNGGNPGGGNNGSNYLANCSAYGGVLVAGGTLCKLQQAVPVSGLSSVSYSYPYYYNVTIPRIDSSQFDVNWAAGTGMIVYPGDKITFSGAGLYGTGSTCNTSFSGNSTNRGPFPFGALLARAGNDGSGNADYFQLTSGANVTVTKAGPLNIGFNLDVLNNVGCFSYYSWDLRVTRCVDNSGTAQQCI